MFGPAGAEILRTGPDAALKRTMGLGWILYGFVKAVRPERIFEIGAGGSSICLLQALKDNACGHLYVVDPFETGPLDNIHILQNYLTDKLGNPLKHVHANFLRQLKKLEFEEICTLFHERSQDLGKSWNHPIDMLVIDGGHTKEEVQADWENFSKWLRPGGYAFVHDFIACTYEAGEVISDACSSDSIFTMLVEPNYLSMAIAQKKFSVSNRMMLFIHRLTWEDNPQRMETPIHLTDARNIPGLLKEWNGSWLPPKEDFHKPQEEAYAEAEKIIKSGIPQTLSVAEEFSQKKEASNSYKNTPRTTIPTKQVTVVIPFSHTPIWGQIVISSLKESSDFKNLDVILMNNSPHRFGIEAIQETTLGENIKIHVPEASSQRSHAGALDRGITMVQTPFMFTLESDCRIVRDGWLDWYLSYAKDDYVAMVGWYWSIGDDVDDGRHYINSSATLYNSRILKMLYQECISNSDLVISYGTNYELRRPLQDWIIEAIKRKNWGPFSECRGFQNLYPVRQRPERWWHEPGNWLHYRASCQWECVKLPGKMIENTEPHSPPHKFNYYGESEESAYLFHYWAGTVSHNYEKHLVIVPWEADCQEWWLKREYKLWEETVPEFIRKASLEKKLVRSFDEELAYAKSRTHILNVGDKVHVYLGEVTEYITKIRPEPNVPGAGLLAQMVGWDEEGLAIVKFEENPIGQTKYNKQRWEGTFCYASVHPAQCVKV